MTSGSVDPGDLASGWYVGRVRHVRHRPVAHRFDSSMMMGLFDLDELDRLDAEVRGFGVDRHSPIGFHTADHGAADGSPLRPWAVERVTDAGLENGLLSISLKRELPEAMKPRRIEIASSDAKGLIEGQAPVQTKKGKSAA